LASDLSKHWPPLALAGAAFWILLRRPFRAARYAPGSPEAVNLFKAAARQAGLPEAWGESPGLHNILRHESDGWVGRPNFTYGDRSRVTNRTAWPSIWAELQAGLVTAGVTREDGSRGVSSATGLGQLLCCGKNKNVEKYYPSGLKGIGDPLEEAIGMLLYIKNRPAYGNPEVAWAKYGKLGFKGY